MKKFKFLLSCLMMMAFCVGFVSCSDDDDKDGNGGAVNSAIVGTWQSTWIKGYETINGVKNEWNEPGSGYVTFMGNGTGIWEESDDEYYIKWKLSGNKISIDFGDGDKETYTVKSVSDTYLVLVSQESETGYSYYNEMSYMRMN